MGRLRIEAFNRFYARERAQRVLTQLDTKPVRPLAITEARQLASDELAALDLLAATERTAADYERDRAAYITFADDWSLLSEAVAQLFHIQVYSRDGITWEWDGEHLHGSASTPGAAFVAALTAITAADVEP